MDICPYCDGEGENLDMATCTDCDGSGIVGEIEHEESGVGIVTDQVKTNLMKWDYVNLAGERVLNELKRRLIPYDR